MQAHRNEILYGNSLDLLQRLSPDSVHCAVTSPPYWNLRSYGGPSFDWPDGWTGRLGEEEEPDLFLDHLSLIFQGVHRVLHPSGTLWLNIGDTYLPSKNLAGIPWRLALRLQNEGWTLRSEVIWYKKSRMPENVRDRPTQTFEPVFMLTKSQSYYYDEVYSRSLGGGANLRNVWDMVSHYSGKHDAVFPDQLPYNGISLSTSEHGCCSVCHAPYVRDVEKVVHDSDRDDHPTRYGNVGSKGAKAHKIPSLKPPEIVTKGWLPTCECSSDVVPCVVLDPFSGSGTTLKEAKRLGRSYIGVDANPETASESASRIGGVDTIIDDFGFGFNQD